MALNFIMMMIHVTLVSVCLAPIGTQGAIGMNWGRVSAQRLIPTQVVDLLLQNGIQHARIYTTELDLLTAFSGSGINLTMTVYDPTMMGDSFEIAQSWVKAKSKYFISANARRVIMGEAMFSKIWNGTDLNKNGTDVVENALRSVMNAQTAFDQAGLDFIKCTLTHDILILKPNLTKPSDAEFVDEIKDPMVRLVRFLEAHDAPFLINMFPITDTINLNLDPTFAFPDNKSTNVVTDLDGAEYTNTVDFMFDSFVWALKKINSTKLQIVVSQVGWPTDGYAGANSTAAERFFRGLLPMVTSNKGTPMRPGAPIDIFIHSLTDEPKMYVTSQTNKPFSRHWGVYRSNGMPKYKIDLSGRDRDIFPIEIKGIMRMPARWCMFNRDFSNVSRVQAAFDNACTIADCTAMAPGGSCSQLTYEMNVSYAFNALFQYFFQDERACDFNGLGYVSLDDPSTPECLFPVEVVKGQQLNYKPPVLYVSPVTKTLVPAPSGSELHRSCGLAMFLAFVVSMAIFMWEC